MHNDRTKVITKIPIQFEALEQLDSRFMKIKVWILNIGKNYNGSIFTKQAVQKALPSIALTPILGYIKSDDDGNKDFSDHRIELELLNNEVKEKYLGHAYGVIPQNPNAKFELRENEFGGLEEYLTVEGLLWTKFDEAIDIMNRDSIKFQSMELSEKYEGYFNSEGYFVFTNFQFFGCCILGSGYEPAIPRSTAEKMFTATEVTSIINDKLEEYRNKFEKKEENDVHKKLMQEFGVSQEQLDKAGIKDIEKYDIEEFKEELRRILDESKSDAEKERVDNQDPNHPNPNPAPNPAPNPNPNPAPNPDPNQDRQSNEFDKDGDKKDVDDKKQSDERDISKADKQKADEKDNAKDKEFDKGTDGKNEIENIKNAMDDLRKDYDKLKEEHQSLIDYKVNKEKEEHQRAINSKIAEFELLSEEEVKEIRENAHSYTVQQAEDRLFAILGRKSTGKETQSKFAKFYVNHEKNVDTSNIPSYDHYFTKHLKK